MVLLFQKVAALLRWAMLPRLVLLVLVLPLQRVVVLLNLVHLVWLPQLWQLALVEQWSSLAPQQKELPRQLGAS